METELVGTWILLGLAAVAFLLAGAMKAFGKRNEKMLEQLPWTNDFSPLQVRLVGAVEVLGAVGLIVPFATRILPWLTPLAGAGLVLVMIGAMVTHLRRKEPKNAVVNVVLAILAGSAAYMAYLVI